LRLQSHISSESRHTFHVSRPLTISQRRERSRLVIHLLFVRIVFLARGYSFEIRLPRFARDRGVSRRVPSSFRQPFELIHSLCLRKCSGRLSLEKIVGSTTKMQHVRNREAQPYSPSRMTLAGKASSRIHTQSTSERSVMAYQECFEETLHFSI